MDAKRCAVVLAGLAVLMPALWAVVRAADKSDGVVPQPTFVVPKDTLRGLQGVAVVVELLNPMVEQLGLTREALQTDTELQLRQYGIKVLSAMEMVVTPGSPYLYIRVTLTTGDSVPFHAISTEVELKQIARLAGNLAMTCCATTWDTGDVFLVGRPRLPEIREKVKDMVARFINDYLAANPKEAKWEGEATEAKPRN